MEKRRTISLLLSIILLASLLTTGAMASEEADAAVEAAAAAEELPAEDAAASAEEGEHIDEVPAEASEEEAAEDPGLDGAPPTKPGGGSGGGSSSSVTWSGATTITSAESTNGQTYSSTTAGQNALLINTSANVTITNPTVTKSGGTSAGDSESFYGTNSAIMCKGGGTTTITGANITTNAAGANGVFSFGGNASTNAASGDGTTVYISDSTITTTGNGSGGIMTTGQGTTIASNLTVSTAGGSSAAIRSDRGGGIVNVDGGTYTTSGTGSPAIYATATINVKNAVLTSTNSQAVVNEGGNTVILENCTVNAGNRTRNGQDYFNNGIFLYQSMSGDASDGASVFTMTGGTLNNTYGHVFHVTNTSAAITLNGVEINNSDSEGVFLSVCSDAWSGLSNKASVLAVDQAIEGDILVGSNAVLDLTLSGGSSWTGTTSGNIKSHKSGTAVSTSLGTVNVTLDASSAWTLTADTYITKLTNTGVTDNSNINLNGHTLYVGGKAITSTAYAAATPTPTAEPTPTPEPVPPTVTISGDGTTAKVEGDYESLYVRVALVIQNGEESGLFVTQTGINPDSMIVIPQFQVPGLTVTGVSVALVPTIDDITSPTPTVIDSDFVMFK